MKKKYKCIGLLARNHGLETLKEIYKHPKFQMPAVFTHQFEPKDHSDKKTERSDFKEFINIANNHGTELIVVNNLKEKNKLEDYILKNSDFDFFISISWRYFIPPEVFTKAKIGAFNIHRGDLPKYAGAEPAKRALENGEKEIVICSHNITEEIDKGEILCKAVHPVNYDCSKSLEDNVKRLKKEITPYFPKLAFESFSILINKYKK